MNQIGAYSFEKLIKAMLQKQLGIGIEFYGGTKDWGKDAYLSKEAIIPPFTTPWPGPIIFQMKFKDLVRRDEEKLRKELKNDLNDEISKILKNYKMKCNGYVFITNIDLTASDINEMGKTLLSFGIENHLFIHYQTIEAFLSDNPRLTWQFPNLIGLSDLESLLDKTIIERSAAYIDSKREEMIRFVPTDMYFKALNILDIFNFVIFEGPPKMGKSINATAICFSKLPLNFEIVDISNPSDFFRHYKPDNAQIFICDDTFGAIQFNSTMGNDWTREFGKVLSRINPNHQLIWTSRTYIIKEALRNTKLEEYNIDEKSITVDIQNLSKIEKAVILYNHIKFLLKKDCGDLKIHYEVLLEKYHEIINHPNFSPESIRQICSIIPRKYRNTNKKEFLILVFSFLDSPAIIWEKEFNRLKENEKIILFILFCEAGKIRIDKLEKKFFEFNGNKQPLIEIKEIIDLLKGTYIRELPKSNYIWEQPQSEKYNIIFYHPSVMDMIYNLWKSTLIYQQICLKIGGFFIFSQILKLREENIILEFDSSIIFREKDITSINSYIREILRKYDLVDNKIHKDICQKLLSLEFIEHYSNYLDSFGSIFDYLLKNNEKIPWILNFLKKSIEFLDVNTIDSIDGWISVFSFIKMNYKKEFDDFFKNNSTFFSNFYDRLNDYIDILKDEAGFRPDDEDNINSINGDLQSFDEIFNDFKFYAPSVDVSEEELKKYYDSISEPDEDNYRERIPENTEKPESRSVEKNTNTSDADEVIKEESQSDEEKIDDIFSDLK